MTAKVVFRKPNPQDGAKVWELIREAGSLDVNSAYCYMMICDYFRDTCVLAEIDGAPVGFVSAMMHPGKPGTLFVWQIAVAASVRGRRIGSRLLDALIEPLAADPVVHIETTISPSNLHSRSLFAGLAARCRAHMQMSEGYPKEWFPAGSAHEDELLFRIGPLEKKRTGGVQI